MLTFQRKAVAAIVVALMSIAFASCSSQQVQSKTDFEVCADIRKEVIDYKDGGDLNARGGYFWGIKRGFELATNESQGQFRDKFNSVKAEIAEADAQSELWNDYKISDDEFTSTLNRLDMSLAPIAKTCADFGLAISFTWVTTTTSTPVQISARCLSQWGYAHNETLNGGTSSFQLGRTAWECTSYAEWEAAARQYGEWTDYLIESVCALDPNSYVCLDRSE